MFELPGETPTPMPRDAPVTAYEVMVASFLDSETDHESR